MRHIRLESASDQLYILLDASDLRALLEQVEGKPAPSEAERLRAAGQRLYGALLTAQESGFPYVHDSGDALALWRTATGK